MCQQRLCPTWVCERRVKVLNGYLKGRVLLYLEFKMRFFGVFLLLFEIHQGCWSSFLQGLIRFRSEGRSRQFESSRCRRSARVLALSLRDGAAGGPLRCFSDAPAWVSAPVGRYSTDPLILAVTSSQVAWRRYDQSRGRMEKKKKNTNKKTKKNNTQLVSRSRTFAFTPVGESHFHEDWERKKGVWSRLTVEPLVSHVTL